MDRESTNDERFSRIRQLLGDEALAVLARSGVTIVGLGAVGGFAAEALARSGIGRLRLIDFDILRTSNINRQILALESTLGEKKCEVARRRVLDIHPGCQVEAVCEFIHRETLATVLDRPGDLVIDAIDSMAPKLELLSALRTARIPLISAMGAALRTDPTAVRVGPLEEIHHCPLAARIRRQLRKRGVPLDIPCVYSTEPVGELRRRAVVPGSRAEEDYFQRGRRRSTLGSLPTLTGIFGLTAAQTAIRMLLVGVDTTLGSGEKNKEPGK